MLNISDLTPKVDYHIARNSNDFHWIGFVEVWNGEELIFHENLTPRDFNSSIDPEAVKAEAQTEAETILARDDVEKFLNDYVFIKNNNLY